VNSTATPRSRLSQAVALLLGLLGVALFLGLFAITQFGAIAPESDSTLARFTHVAGNVFFGIFFAGALPATLAAYFWLYRRESSTLVLGLLVVSGAVLIHYLAVAVVAHGTTSMAALAILVECTLGVGAILWAQRHLGKRNARAVQ
jgi:hypothetical protein